jgi:dephospho-CoA kinase
MLIGITGKSGSGKTSVAARIAEERPNTVHLNIDTIGHEVITHPTIIELLQQEFDEDLMTDGKIDRKKLGDVVFNSRNRMQKLTEITWSEMQKMIDQFIEENQDKDIILDWLLLPKTEYFKKCDVTILIDVPYEIRLERAMKRDNITAEKFRERENNSVDFDSSIFDAIFINEDFEKTCEKVRKKI